MTIMTRLLAGGNGYLVTYQTPIVDTVTRADRGTTRTVEKFFADKAQLAAGITAIIAEAV